MNEELGKPDKIEIYEKNGCRYEKKIWITENGEVTLITCVSIDNNPINMDDVTSAFDEYLDAALSREDISSFFDPFQTSDFMDYLHSGTFLDKKNVTKKNPKVIKNRLEAQLQKAVEEERFEDAAKLRDELNELEK